MGSETKPMIHVLLVSLPSQGNVNPLLELGKRLASQGLLVTFTSTENIGKAMREANGKVEDEAIPVGKGFLRFEFFNDDPRQPFPSNLVGLGLALAKVEPAGKVAIPEMVKRNSEAGRPVSCLIYNQFMWWVADVAEELGLPSAMLWVEAVASFSISYHFIHGLAKFPTEVEPHIDTKLPWMPLLEWNEIPGYLHPHTQSPYHQPAIRKQFGNAEKNFCVLVDTFEQLEPDLVKYMSKFVKILPIGPLHRNVKNDKQAVVRGDIKKADMDCIQWLDKRPERSVVYISFGSIAMMSQDQTTELAHGLLKSGVSFLWVIRPQGPQVNLPEGFMEAVGEKGKVISWSPQQEVLAHPSVGLFMTHCGWNSTIEALTCGVPVVAFPQWGDQIANAKFIEEVFKVGVRVCKGEGKTKLVGRDVLERCLLEASVGSKAEEIRKSAAKWKKAAEEAVAEGGSSEKNLKVFVEDLRKQCGGQIGQNGCAQPNGHL